MKTSRLDVLRSLTMTKNKPRPGSSLEQLVYRLESILGDTENVTVEANLRLPDKVTSRLREHDVVLTVRSRHHVVRIGIECRDRTRPVGVPQVEQFHQKCIDTNIDKGVIVSPSGFRKTARQKAAHLGIACHTLAEIERQDTTWLGLDALHVYPKTVHRQHWQFLVPADTEADVTSLQRIVFASGETLDQSDMNQIINRILGDTPSIKHTEPGRHIFVGTFPRDRLQNLRAIVDSCDAPIPLEKAHVVIEYEVHKQLVPLKAYRYANADADTTIIEAATAHVDLPHGSADFTFTYQRDSEGGAVLGVRTDGVPVELEAIGISPDDDEL